MTGRLADDDETCPAATLSSFSSFVAPQFGQTGFSSALRISSSAFVSHDGQ
jgi:hypothetical protein